jgi:uncharacterized protein (DUF2252 family)
MGEDLKHPPGVAVQACGDCHLMNFEAFATPEDNILFDIMILMRRCLESTHAEAR